MLSHKLPIKQVICEFDFTTFSLCCQYLSMLLFLTSSELEACCLYAIPSFISVCYLLKEMGKVFGKFKTRIRKGTILWSYTPQYLMKRLKHVFFSASFKIIFSHPFIGILPPCVDLVNIIRSQICYLMCTQDISNCPRSFYRKHHSILTNILTFYSSHLLKLFRTSIFLHVPGVKTLFEWVRTKVIQY